MATTAIIETINISDTVGVISLPYAECTTDAATAAKAVTLSDGAFQLTAGAQVRIKFTNTNSAANPTLNVQGTGNKSIKNIASNNLIANYIYDFIYDGTSWQVLNVPEIFAGNNNGLVPKPAATSTTTFLSANGTWEQTTQITIDATLNDSSTNPVQNSVVTVALNSKANTSDIPGRFTNIGDGLVPAPGTAITDTAKYFLNADGDWSKVDANTINIGGNPYTASISDGVLTFTLASNQE